MKPRFRLYARIGAIELWECRVPGSTSCGAGTSREHAYKGWQDMGSPA